MYYIIYYIVMPPQVKAGSTTAQPTCRTRGVGQTPRIPVGHPHPAGAHPPRAAQGMPTPRTRPGAPPPIGRQPRASPRTLVPAPRCYRDPFGKPCGPRTEGCGRPASNWAGKPRARVLSPSPLRRTWVTNALPTHLFSWDARRPRGTGAYI